MNRKNLAVIGVGNMAKAIIGGIAKANIDIDNIYLFDVNSEQYSSILSDNIIGTSSLKEALCKSDCVLLSVKPQNFMQVLSEIKTQDGYQKKLYITIGAGISTDYIKAVLGNVAVLRVLPNLPMVIGMGVSVICRNAEVDASDFELVKSLFNSAGSVLEIEEEQMNAIIGVTSSSPAYVFKFISAICNGARMQGIDSDDLLTAVCDMVIGSAQMLKSQGVSPDELISRVCSKGGTTERAISSLNEAGFDSIISDAMIACTARADELGS